MDLINYPLHLTSNELDYELNIRGISNVSNNRVKTSTLRKQLNDEEKGLLEAPKSSELFDANAEFFQCRDSFDDILEKYEQAIGSKLFAEIPRCISRLWHVQMRLERIRPHDVESANNIDLLLASVYDLIVRVNETDKTTRKPAAARRVTTHAPLTNLSSGNETTPIARPLPNHTAIGSPSMRPTPTRNVTIAPPAFHPYSSTDCNTSLDRITTQIDAMHFSNFENTACGNASSNETLIEFNENAESVPQNPNVFRRVEQIPRTFERVADSYAAAHNLRAPQPFMQMQCAQPPVAQQTFVHNPFADYDAGFNPQLRNQMPQGNRAADSYIPRSRPRNAVPINQWKITFSGDGNGLHLYDFLKQVQIFQRAENVSDDEMLHSIIHLLAGRARSWYFSVVDHFVSWPQIVTAMKREFLPSNYEYMLFSDISNRVQKPNESFAEFITHMQSLFNCLATPLGEEHKLFVVQKNLLPRYAMAIAPLQLRTLSELNDACRRIDNAASIANRNTYSMPYETPQPKHNVFAVQYDNVAPISVSRSGPVRRERCWNCEGEGHSYRECTRARTGVFCYKCGAKNVTTTNCRICSGNGRSGPAPNGPARDPSNQN